jgi:hypothetical protein
LRVFDGGPAGRKKAPYTHKTKNKKRKEKQKTKTGEKEKAGPTREKGVAGVDEARLGLAV